MRSMRKRTSVGAPERRGRGRAAPRVAEDQLDRNADAALAPRRQQALLEGRPTPRAGQAAPPACRDVDGAAPPQVADQRSEVRIASTESCPRPRPARRVPLRARDRRDRACRKARARGSDCRPRPKPCGPPAGCPGPSVANANRPPGFNTRAASPKHRVRPAPRQQQIRDCELDTLRAQRQRMGVTGAERDRRDAGHACARRGEHRAAEIQCHDARSGIPLRELHRAAARRGAQLCDHRRFHARERQALEQPAAGLVVHDRGGVEAVGTIEGAARGARIRQGDRGALAHGDTDSGHAAARRPLTAAVAARRCARPSSRDARTTLDLQPRPDWPSSGASRRRRSSSRRQKNRAPEARR